jgi:CrcB protein
MTPYGFLAVGIGGALGCWLRWVLGIAFNPLFPNMLMGTLAANLTGGYLIGVAIEYFTHHDSLPPELRLFVIVGFLGGLTTFSSFSAEAVELLADNQLGLGICDGRVASARLASDDLARDTFDAFAACVKPSLSPALCAR